MEKEVIPAFIYNAMPCHAQAMVGHFCIKERQIG
jgi:hypothetical protein